MAGRSGMTAHLHTAAGLHLVLTAAGAGEQAGGQGAHTHAGRAGGGQAVAGAPQAAQLVVQRLQPCQHLLKIRPVRTEQLVEMRGRGERFGAAEARPSWHRQLAEGGWQ